MTKPLLLLVDDDQALLEALEAELSPTFGDGLRIESFDCPADVIEALPLWQRERKPIALAIVDQKMPGLTGIELIRRLRDSALETPQGPRGPGERPASFHPASATRTVLLTAYGGPEVALAAKTQAGADRYREKPWIGRQLATDVRELLRDFWQEASQEPSTAYRDLVSKEDLRRLWNRLELLPEGSPRQGTDPEPGVPDEVARLLNAARWSAGTREIDPEAEASLLAFIQGLASPEQEAIVRSALLDSVEFRAEFRGLVEGLTFLRSGGARSGFDGTSVPEAIQGLARHALNPGKPEDGAP